MGSCFSEAVHKFQVYEEPRFYKGDIQHEHIDESKYKSKSSKLNGGTNTFQDIEHENQPIHGDIYSRFGSRNLQSIRTMPNIQIPGPILNTSYGLNPYVEKQEVYNRARTDNPLRNVQLTEHGLYGSNNFTVINNQNQNNNIYQSKSLTSSEMKKGNQKENQNQNNSFKPTVSRYI